MRNPRFPLFLFVVLAMLAGCSDDPAGPENGDGENSPPNISLTIWPQDGTDIGTPCKFSWDATDSDGTVAGYYYTLDGSEPDTWTEETTCSLQVLSAGTHTFSVQAVDDQGARSNPATHSFETVDLTAEFSVTANTLDFGTVLLDSQVEKQVTITNLGTRNVTGSAAESAPHYRITVGSGSYALGPGASHTVTVRFKPTTVGTHAGTVSLGIGTHVVSCTGIGSGDAADVRLNEKMILADIQPWQLQSVAAGTYTYDLTDDSPRIQPGDIIVGEANGGYLRKVTRVVAQRSNQLVVETTLGNLVDGIERLDVDETLTLPLDLTGVTPPGVQVSGDSLIMSHIVLVDADIPPGGPLHLYAALDRAYVAFDAPTLDFDLHISSGSVTEIRTLYHSRIALGCDISVDVTAFLTYDMPPIELYKKTDYYTTWVWFVPVVHEITTTVELNTHFELLGELETDITGLGVEQVVDVGARYQGSNWENLNDVQLTVTQPDIQMSAMAQATLRPYLEIKVVDKLYKVAGPSVRAEPYVEGVATVFLWPPPIYWCLDVGIGCDVGCGFEFMDIIPVPNWSSPGFNIGEIEVFSDCWYPAPGVYRVGYDDVSGR